MLRVEDLSVLSGDPLSLKADSKYVDNRFARIENDKSVKFLRDFGVDGFYRLSVLANKGFSLEESMIIFKLENDLDVTFDELKIYYNLFKSYEDSVFQCREVQYHK